MDKKFPWVDETPETVPLVVVNWQDIQYVEAWNEDEEVGPARKLRTVGWLLYAGPDFKDPSTSITVIAGTYDGENKRWADYYCFPSVVINKVDANEKVAGGSDGGFTGPFVSDTFTSSSSEILAGLGIGPEEYDQ